MYNASYLYLQLPLTVNRPTTCLLNKSCDTSPLHLQTCKQITSLNNMKITILMVKLTSFTKIYMWINVSNNDVIWTCFIEIKGSNLFMLIRKTRNANWLLNRNVNGDVYSTDIFKLKKMQNRMQIKVQRQGFAGLISIPCTNNFGNIKHHERNVTSNIFLLSLSFSFKCSFAIERST